MTEKIMNFFSRNMTNILLFVLIFIILFVYIDYNNSRKINEVNSVNTERVVASQSLPLENKSQTLIDADETLNPKSVTTAQVLNTAQAVTPEPIVKCKAEYYDVEATASECKEVEALDDKADKEMDDLLDEFEKCGNDALKRQQSCSDEAVADMDERKLRDCVMDGDDKITACEDDLKYKREEVVEDLGRDIDIIIR